MTKTLATDRTPGRATRTPGEAFTAKRVVTRATLARQMREFDQRVDRAQQEAERLLHDLRAMGHK